MNDDNTSPRRSRNAGSGTQDLEVLTRTIEGILRRLTRLLIGRISLPKLEELVRVIFIQEAQQELQAETPSRTVSLSTISVLTGLDTRVLSKALKDFNHDEPIYKQANLLAEITPECTVLDAWHSRDEFRNDQSGKPKVLSIKGERDSFEHLLRVCLPKRGMTASSMLRRLIDSGNVKYSENSDFVELVDEQYSPFRSRNETATLEIGLAAVGNLLGTLNYNVQTVLEDCGETFYQRGCWTHRVPIEKQSDLRKALKNCLTKADQEARSILAEYEEDADRAGQASSGVGMFYFEEDRGIESALEKAKDRKLSKHNNSE